MKSQINILRQLQELVLTRDEHHQTGDGSHLDSLNESIAALQAKLIPQVAALYDRLYKTKQDQTHDEFLDLLLAQIVDGMQADVNDAMIEELQQILDGEEEFVDDGYDKYGDTDRYEQAENIVNNLGDAISDLENASFSLGMSGT